MEHPCCSKRRSSEGADGLIRPQMVVVRYHVASDRCTSSASSSLMISVSWGGLNGVAVVPETISEVASESLDCWSWEDQRKE